MTDHFTLLNQPRRPWLDPDSLKSKFLALSSDSHPDRSHSASPQARETAHHRYAELNAAYNCLREPKNRLLHLLELERGTKPPEIQQIPDGLMEMGFTVGQLCNQAKTFLSQHRNITSPILKVDSFKKGQQWTDRLTELRQTLGSHQDALLSELKTLNPPWEQAPSPPSPQRLSLLPLNRLEEIYRLLSYLARWTSQIQTEILELSL